MNQSDLASQTITIDGLSVSYRRVGNGSRKVLFFHGFPGSSVQIELFRSVLEEYDLEVLCFDRPGYGDTDYTREPQHQLTAKIAKGMLSHLGWTICEVMSVSGGTPFLFSFVRTYPELASRVTVVSGLGPFSSKGFKGIMKRKSKWALKLLPLVPDRWLSVVKLMSIPKRTKMMRRFLPTSKPDQEFMNHPEARSVIVRGLNEALMQNGRGPKRDARTFNSKWNANLGRYAGRVDIWHGSEDHILPAEMAERMSAAIEGSQLTVVPGEGHYSLVVKNVAKILAFKD